MTTKPSLKFVGTSIVCQEVPGEIAFTFSISGCPHKCAGCHSKYLWDDIGDALLDNLVDVLSPYKEYITCVCFMGGDQNMAELRQALLIVKDFGLKTCLYSGLENIDDIDPVIHLLDYCKVGRYDEKLGGLNSPETNQRMYKVIDGVCINITSEFQKKKE